jgi:murein L,D-transpeptidase YcbB/YkuD
MAIVCGADSATILTATQPTIPQPSQPPLTRTDAEAIVQAMARGRREGIPTPDAAEALATLSSPDPSAREAADTALTGFAVELAGAEHGRLVDPQRVDRNFALRQTYDASKDFAAARQAGRVAAWTQALTPADPTYASLVAARARYAAIIAAGGWPAVPDGRALKLASGDPRTPILRQRLNVEGYAAGPAPTPPPAGAPAASFDASLADALRDFQASHGLKADGVLTPETTAALNVPPEDRLASIDANLERERWLPRELPADRIEVDTGEARATLIEAGAPVLTMRAIVGQPTKRTPTFVSQVVAVEFNPPWIVPPDIAAKELYPKQRRSPGYFARNDFYVSGGQLIQRAGPKSSLGYVKFDIPDAFDVYLHDTPARTLFARDKRWLSHGCMRIENPRDLAAALLGPQGWNRTTVDAAIAAGATRTVRLKTPVPVFVVYRTVVADAAGHASFRSDVYGWDAELEAALAARQP